MGQDKDSTKTISYWRSRNEKRKFPTNVGDNEWGEGKKSD